MSFILNDVIYGFFPLDRGDRQGQLGTQGTAMDSQVQQWTLGTLPRTSMHTRDTQIFVASPERATLQKALQLKRLFITAANQKVKLLAS